MAPLVRSLSPAAAHGHPRWLTDVNLLQRYFRGIPPNPQNYLKKQQYMAFNSKQATVVNWRSEVLISAMKKKTKALNDWKKYFL